MPAQASALGRRVVGPAQPPQELVALVCSFGVLLHHLAEEVRDLALLGILGVAHVLPVVMARLERVVLDRDQVPARSEEMRR